MTADPKDLVNAIEAIREAIRLNKMRAISDIEKEAIITLAAEKACQSLTDLYGDEEFWSTLRESGIAKALKLADLTIVDQELDRSTIKKISDFMIALGMKEHEAYEFVSGEITLIKKALKEHPLPQRKTTNMAHSATGNLREEVCNLMNNQIDILSRMRNRSAIYKEIFNKAIGGVTGSLFGFLSTSELAEKLPLEARAVSELLTDQERVSVFKLFYASLSSEMMPPPPVKEILME